MNNEKEFIKRVAHKMGYSNVDYTVIEDSGIYEEMESDVLLNIENRMVFLNGTCVPKSTAQQVAQELNKSETIKVLTLNKWGGISIILSIDCEPIEGVSIKRLCDINRELNTVIRTLKNLDTNPKKPNPKEFNLKDYYRESLPNNRIGRKSDSTLLSELNDAGFSL